MRRTLLILWLCLLFSGVIALFWRNEWIYSLPTPVPARYKAVLPGETISLPHHFSAGDKPLFLHFFNPACPCSRFNMPHFKSLVNRFGKEVNFAIVVMSSKKYSEKAIQEKYGLTIPVFFDSSLAASCGVYSTPQAVILQNNGRLYYRGNYNRNRYCTEQKSNYAQLALQSLLQQKRLPVTEATAFIPYGCQLPTCKK